MVFSLFDREYHIFGDAIISDDEANTIYEKLLMSEGDKEDKG